MPRLVNRIPSYRRHRPSDQAIVTLDGKRIYLGKWDTAESREKYRRLIAQWLANGRKLPAECAGGDFTIVELIDRYWSYAEGYYRKNGRPSSEMGCIREALRPLHQAYGHTAATEFGPIALKTVRHSMQQAGWARSTINNRIARIKRMFKWATANELVPPDVFHGLQAVAGLKRGRSGARETKPVKPVLEEYVSAIAPFVSGQVWAMIQLQLLTGMRPGEVVIMRPSDMDVSGKIWSYTPAEHKTEHHGHIRRIYIGPKAQDVIRPFLARESSAYLFRPREAEEERLAARSRARKTPLSCGNRPGTNRRPGGRRRHRDRYDAGSYRRAIQMACKRAFSPPEDLTTEQIKQWHREHRWHPHQLRHNAGTKIRRECGIEIARLVLGHHSAVVTELYAEMDGRKAEEVMHRIG